MTLPATVRATRAAILTARALAAAVPTCCDCGTALYPHEAGLCGDCDRVSWVPVQIDAPILDVDDDALDTIGPDPIDPVYKGTIQASVERVKREVLADIASGRVPATVRSFSELHDHVDANEYGGACETDENGIGWWDMGRGQHEEVMRFWNGVQNAVDAWLKDGRK